MAFLLIVCLGCLLLPEGASTAAQGARLVRVGYTDHPGFIMQREDGSYYGMGVEYFEEAASYSGWQCKFVNGSRGTGEKLATGEIDFIAPVMKTSERNRLYEYPAHAIRTTVSGTCVNANDTIYYDDYAHMKNIRIGGTPGSFQMLAAREYARAHGFTFTEIDDSDCQQALAAQDAGEIDMMTLSSLYRIQGYRIVATTVSPFYVAAGKDNQTGILDG